MQVGMKHSSIIMCIGILKHGVFVVCYLECIGILEAQRISSLPFISVVIYKFRNNYILNSAALHFYFSSALELKGGRQWILPVWF